MYTLNAFFNVWTCWEVSESVSNVIEWRLWRSRSTKCSNFVPCFRRSIIINISFKNNFSNKLVALNR